MSAEDFGIVQSFNYDFCDLDFYVTPEDVEEWNECPFCNQRPKVWIFDNGRYAGCGCLLREYSRYHRFHIKAESICEHLRNNNGSALNYNRDELRENWNHFCNSQQDLSQKPNNISDKN